MFLSTYNLVLILGLLSLRAAATALEAPWVVPDGNSTDFTQTFTNGAPLAIAWEGWDTNTRLFVLGDITKANLWVTSFDFKEVQYSQLLAEKVDITGPGSYSWTVNINAKSLSTTAKFVLRFSKPGDNYDNAFSGPSNIPSPGFIVLPGTATSSSSSSTPSTSSASIKSSTTASRSSQGASTIAATSGSSTSSTSTSTSTSASTARAATGLKTGAIVGITVGSVVGSIAVIALAVLAFLRWRRNKIQSGKRPPPPRYELKGYYAPQQGSHPQPMNELPSAVPVPVPEFSTSSNTSELPS